jgi:phospholipid/cholesterol/gamma-HCH transport system substrate-binding protein
MDERVVKFRVGVMVIATLLLAGILVVLFSDTGSLVRGRYTVIIHFDEAPGVTEGTPVRKSGILIGRVSKVDFAEQGGVNVTVEINDGVELRRSEVPQVSGSLLGGDVVIQFVQRPRPPSTTPPAETQSPPPGEPNDVPPESRTGAGQPPANQGAAAPKTPVPSSDELIKPGDYIQGTVAPSPVQVITNLQDNLAVAVDSLSHAGSEVGKVAASINKMLEGNEDQINQIIANTDKTLQSFQRALANVEDVIGDPEVRENLRRSIDELPQLLSDTRAAMNTVRTTVESVDRNMRNLEGFTGPLGERGEQMVDRVDRTIARMDGLLAELSEFGKKLNSGEGSLGRILRDPDLYQNLNKAAQNLARLTCELQPVVADARVFADKIARHPELLGVRGAIQRSPGTK